MYFSPSSRGSSRRLVEMHKITIEVAGQFEKIEPNKDREDGRKEQHESGDYFLSAIAAIKKENTKATETRNK